MPWQLLQLQILELQGNTFNLDKNNELVFAVTVMNSKGVDEGERQYFITNLTRVRAYILEVAGKRYENVDCSRFYLGILKI